eukprot:766604-Hanusia_phi.AAC.2
MAAAIGPGPLAPPSPQWRLSRSRLLHEFTRLPAVLRLRAPDRHYRVVFHDHPEYPCPRCCGPGTHT